MSIWRRILRCCAKKYAIQEAFLSFEQLELRGGAIRFDGKIQAFSFGKKINDDTAVLHVEKARHDVRGLYTAITKEFAAHAWTDVKYLNREEIWDIQVCVRQKWRCIRNLW